MALTDKAISAARVKPGKSFRVITDARRLFLRITPDGAKSWRLKYRVNGKETMASLGHYPDVSISDARKAADKIRGQVADGVNPAAQRREVKEQEQSASALTFRRVGEEWLAHDDSLAERTREKRRWLFDLLAPLHAKPCTEIKRSDVRKALLAIQDTGQRESARRAGQVAAAIFKYGRDNYEDIIKENPATERSGWLKPVNEKHHAGVTDPKELGILVALADGGVFSNRLPTVANALRFLLRVPVRHGELIGAEWSEFHQLDDAKRAEWRIPAHRMKGKVGSRKAFTVPLSRQAAAILQAQQKVSGTGTHVFPDARRSGNQMSNGALKGLLGAMGYEPEQMTPHGVRTTFATLARDALRFDTDLVERCLAHSHGNAVRGAYDRSERFEERRALMQAWADYLDKLSA